ncbi:RNA-binding cell elongation regulator Jag/EloR [Paenibacillus contaminans]|uniref:RNA-binding protein KhpB n=1 Tax=Paenibacillus contaminans TaxID=450362 RepID=A0A329MNP3_9BACL|nr:RNA-binding cell elongation regulator Jag/EloR [Paenibacillus contaminans]RAV19527.1 protein jag [Paenibacillus contaminans]
MKKIVVSAKSVEEAVKQGLAQLNVSEDRVNVSVLEQPSKGLFGLIGSKGAKVELEVIPDPIEETISFLQNVFRTMELNVRVEKQSDKDGVLLNLTGSELGILIGRRGQTLDALQYLTNIVANRFSTSHVRIVLDAEQFRERRRQTLEQLSERLASRVIRSKKEVVLEPMSPQERKVIHSHLQDHPSVKTYSKGEEPNRRVVIVMR